MRIELLPAFVSCSCRLLRLLAGRDIKWRVRKDLDGVVIRYVEAGSVVDNPVHTRLEMPGWIWEKEIDRISRRVTVL